MVRPGALQGLRAPATDHGVLDDGVGTWRNQVFVSVVGADAVRGSAPVTEHFDDLCDLVGLAHGPAVRQQPVARVCLHRE